jgi:hypothetical protein
VLAARPDTGVRTAIADVADHERFPARELGQERSKRVAAAVEIAEDGGWPGASELRNVSHRTGSLAHGDLAPGSAELEGQAP